MTTTHNTEQFGHDQPDTGGETRLGGSGDAVTVVGGLAPPDRRRRDDPAPGGRGGGDASRPGPPPLPEPAGRRRGPAGATLAWIAVAVVCLAAAGVFAGLYFTKGSTSHDARTGGPDAEALRSTANQFANALFTFDAGTLNQNITQAQALSTPAYSQTIASFYTADQVAAAKTAQASSRADIKSVFVESINGDSASVFVVLTDTYANNKDPKPRVDDVRMILSLKRSSGAWKVSDVQVLQAPPAATAPANDGGAPTPSSTPASPPASS
jgi:hypothetical protein